ncbi:MAG: GPW/gp25 family protein [Saccharothrix sp.]|nr:GPW/gp25 family protein [Saccharothrix sp.]
MDVRALGQGLAFPVRRETAGLRVSSGADKVRQSILLILSTAPGERQMRPDFGCAIHDLVFQPNTPALHGLVITKVREALIAWEPRVDLLDVAVEVPPGSPDCVLIRVDYQVRATNAAHNLVYPFFVDEGGIDAVGGSW